MICREPLDSQRLEKQLHARAMLAGRGTTPVVQFSIKVALQPRPRTHPLRVITMASVRAASVLRLKKRTSSALAAIAV